MCIYSEYVCIHVCIYVCVYMYILSDFHFTHYIVSDSASMWTVAHQAPLSMGFPGKNTGVGCHFLLLHVCVCVCVCVCVYVYIKSNYPIFFSSTNFILFSKII